MGNRFLRFLPIAVSFDTSSNNMKFKHLLLFSLAIVLWNACKNNTNPQPATPEKSATTAASTETLPWAGDKDFVCGMHIDQTVEDTVHFGGKVYGFCSPSCKESFQAEPAKYVGK